MNNLFVYGTLMRKDGKIHPLLSGKASFICESECPGQIVMDVYPYLIPYASGYVKGEVYSIYDLTVIRDLDEYEGCQYRRIKMPVEVEGQSIGAWVYAKR